MSTEPTSPASTGSPERTSLWILLIAAGAILILGGGGAFVLARMGRPFYCSPFAAVSSTSASDASADVLRKKAALAMASIKKVEPHGAYIVVDTFGNRLRLYDDGELKRAAVCSTGTGRILRDPRTGHQWVFDTPLGEREVREKRPHPVWAKPDWAYIEDGYLPPPAGASDRFDDASLGDWALYMGDGYIIHGTLFKTLLGRRVTHGCIRLGDEDLDYVYHHAPIGTRVYLY